MAGAGVVTLCRRILRELSRIDSEAVRGPTWSCIASEVRLHRSVSDEQLLLGKRQLLAVVLSYFESTREHRELLSRYQGKGERSIEESANLVGLTLPERRP